MEKYITESEEQTKEIAKELAKSLKPKDIVTLDGDLGCGKTAFTKGIVSYFGNEEDVTSPTFTLVNEYDGDVQIFHFDVYRLENASLDQCDWMDDYLFGDGICVIEWSDYINEIIPKDAIRVRFLKLPEKGDNFREIQITNRRLV